MRPQPLAVQPVHACDMRKAPETMGGNFYMHRFAGVEHTDGETCWCDPLLWTVEECTTWPLRDIQARLDEFFCVH